MAPAFLQFDTRRAKSYIFRLPLCTRIVLFFMVVFYIITLVDPSFASTTSLIPNEVNFPVLHRLNSFPIVHLGIFHLLLNAIALTPLLERFEAENGSLVTLLLLTGPFATLPGGLYVLVERFIFRSNVTIAGASIWVFLLLAIEAMKTYKSNPNFNVAGYSIPTWTTPLIGNLFIAFLIPNTSFTGHLCGLLFGYLWGLGYIKFLVPNEKILRWVENKLNLLGRLPHYVSVDQKTYGRYGVLPTTNASPRTATSLGQVPNGAPSPGAGYVGSTQRLGS